MWIFRMMHKCLECKSGGYSFASKNNMGWLQLPSSNHPERDIFFYVKPQCKKWEFHTTWRRSRLPFSYMQPSQQDMAIVNHICKYAARVGKEGRLVATTYCNERLDDLTKKIAMICECY